MHEQEIARLLKQRCFSEAGALLEKRWADHCAHRTGEELDLSGLNLSGAHFRGWRFWLVSFKRANLQGSNFEGAFLENSIFNGADVRGANFIGANLEDVFFSGANVDRASFDAVFRSELANQHVQNIEQATFA